jgi:membrane-bound lytic murein transglycosylase A
VPIGRILVERNIIPREAISFDRIREWMRTNPRSADEILRQNRSFMFFRIVGLSDDREAVGAQGVPLTSGRSIAIDNALHAYGTPFFIQAHLPLTNEKRSASFARLMIAQDTGSAIVGPARADIYFGAGDQAGQLASRIHRSGTFAMLVPRELDPVVTGAQVPLPPERPSTAAPVSARTPAPKSNTICSIFGSPCTIAGRAEALRPDWDRKSLGQVLRTRSPLSLTLRRQTSSPHPPSWSNLSAQ